MSQRTWGLDSDQRTVEPPPPIRSARTMPGSRPRNGLPPQRPYVRAEGAAEREAEVAQLRAQTIAQAAGRVPEWEPWMRRYADATNWGATFTVDQWREKRRLT